MFHPFLVATVVSASCFCGIHSPSFLFKTVFYSYSHLERERDLRHLEESKAGIDGLPLALIHFYALLSQEYSATRFSHWLFLIDWHLKTKSFMVSPGIGFG